MRCGIAHPPTVECLAIHSPGLRLKHKTGQGEKMQIAKMTSGHSSSSIGKSWRRKDSVKISGVMLLFVESDVTMTIANPSEATQGAR